MRGPSPRRWLPLLLVAAAVALALAFRVDRIISFENLAAHRDWLVAQVDAWGSVATALFITGYAIAVGISLPGATVLTLLSGFLFGPVWGTIYAVIGATLGAMFIFLAAKTAVADLLRARASPFLRRLEAGFRRDAFFYLLFLRLVPVFPFWLVNLVPALLGVSLPVFVIATFFGIIPATAVYASVGATLGALIEAGQRPDLGVILEPRVLLPLLALAVLALLPVLFKRFRRGSAQEGA